MDNEHLFATLAGAESDTSDSTGRSHSPDPAVDDRLAELLEDLDRIQVGPMPRHRADRALDLLGQFQTRVASMMCDISRSVSESDANSDPAEMLRTKARLPRRDSKRLARVARHLEDMPKAKEKFANGEITVDQANALANAAEKVGSEAVEADDSLLESADRMLPDKFGRHAKEWADRILIERGMNPLQRQREAREAKLWVEDRTGLGVLMAKLPAPQFEHLRQAVDRRYMELLRRDGADSQDTDKVRSPQAPSRRRSLRTPVQPGRRHRPVHRRQSRRQGQGRNPAGPRRADGSSRRHRPRRPHRDDRRRSRTAGHTSDAHARHRAGRDGLRPDRASPLAGTQPAPRQRRPTPGNSRPRQGMLRMRGPQCTAANSTTSKNGTATVAPPTWTIWLFALE